MSMKQKTSPVAVLVLVVAGGCYTSVDIPRCETLADCPAGQGYTSCEDGYCFKAGRCDEAAVVAGDGCCAKVEGDRSADTDCLTVDVDLGCLDVAGPVADSEGGILVTCRTVDGLVAHTGFEPVLQA